MNLSKRLTLIASLVPAGSCVCDVGTDHGYLPAFLYKSGKCKSVCATDIRKKPLDTARRNLEAAGIRDVNLYLCDGLDLVPENLADTVVIAGMGGEVTVGIIDRAARLKDPAVTLILQPTTSADKLRDYLGNNGFIIATERAVEENGKIYSVMKAHYCGIPYPIDDVRRVIGLIKPDYDEGRAYILKQYSVIKKRADELENTGKNALLYNESRKVEAKLKGILKQEG